MSRFIWVFGVFAEQYPYTSVCHNCYVTEVNIKVKDLPRGELSPTAKRNACTCLALALDPLTMLAVVVTIVAHADRVEEMIAALEGNRAHSRHEPDCLKWEWSQHIEDPTKFAIYELYTDRDAFAAHKASAHFAAWVEASTPCMKEKVAGQYEVKGPDIR